MIIMDTDICIEILRGNKKIIQHRAGTEKTVAISFISAGELFYGAKKSFCPEKNIQLVRNFLNTLPVIHTTLSIMQCFGLIKSELETEGHRLPDADLLVAATALTAGASLATGNIRHFQRFDQLPLVSWLR